LLAARGGGNRAGGALRLPERPLAFACPIAIVPTPRDRVLLKRKGTEMLRKLRGVCHFPEFTSKIATALLLIPLAFPLLWAGLLFGGLACSFSEPWRLTSSTDLKAAAAPDFSHMQATPQPDMSSPNVTRSQKPETD